MFDLDHFRYYVGNPSAWDSYDQIISDRMRAAADEIERLTAVLESLTKDPPPTLSREPDADWEVIIKMRAIAREALKHP